MTFETLESRAIQHEKRLFRFQITAVKVLFLGALGVGCIELVAPNFFSYPYLKWGGWVAVSYFWPLLAEGILLNLILWRFGSPSWPIRLAENREILRWELVTSTLAGLWEELGYRYIFICYAMLGIAFINWLISKGFGGFLSFILVCACVGTLIMKEWLVAVCAGIGAVLTGLFAAYANPLYWFYAFIAWIIHFTTLTFMDPVLYGEHDRLFVFGAILANSWFRDGHKYQGPLGLVNSWYGGMVLLYATVMYGLFTAIAVHILYDVLIGVVRYATQETTD